MGVLVLGPDVHRGMISLGEGVELMGRGYAAVAASSTKLSNPRTRTNTPGGFRLTVHQGVDPTSASAFASARGERVAPAGQSQSYPGRGVPVFSLFSTETAELLMVMIGEPKAPGYEDVSGIAAFQTACCAIYGTDVAAHPDASVVGVLGSGAQAILHLAALAARRDVKEAYVYSPTPQKRSVFAERMTGQLGIPVHACDDARAVVERAEILLVCTNSNVPVFDGDWLQSGAHVTSIVHSNKEMLEAGLVQSMRQEIDDRTLERADVLITTTRAQEELDQPAVLYGAAQRGVFDWESVIEIPEILNGSRSIEEVHKRAGITFLHNAAGWALGGAPLLRGFYDKASELGRGETLDIPELERE